MVNYPIKLGLMELYKPTGRHDDYGDTIYEVFAVVPVPCYVIKESTIYNEDGSFENEYEVVFMRDNIYFKFLKENSSDNIPIYNQKRNVTNSTIVPELYEDFEEAVKTCDFKNEEFACLHVPIDNLEELWPMYKKEIDSYYAFSLSLYNKYKKTHKEKRLIK